MNDELYFHLGRVKQKINEYSDVPEWNSILIIEDKNIVHGETMQLPNWALSTLENYEQRFKELVSEGYCWINIVIRGIVDNILILSIEIPSYQSAAPIEKVSVNLSGPCFADFSNGDKELRWDISKSTKVTE